MQNVGPTKLITRIISNTNKRRVGKKQTPNFLSRYKYGNKKESGIVNIHVNIRSLKFKIQEIKNIIHKKCPHIIGISEAELKKSNTDVNSLKIPGYTILFPKSWENGGYARVIVYVKKSFKFEHVLDLENEDVQSIWIRGHFRNRKNIYLCHACREHMAHLPLANQRSKLEEFLIQWDQALEYQNSNDVNEVHVSLDMNLYRLNDKWFKPTYKRVFGKTGTELL